MRALFHDDAEMHLDGRPYVGIDEVMTIFTGTQGTLEASDRPPLIRHFTATHQIDLSTRTTPADGSTSSR